MKHVLITLICLLPVLCAGAQEPDVIPTLHVVNDPDGYVYLRRGPGKEHDIDVEIRTKTVVKQIESEEVVNGWVPVEYCSSSGYIYHDRLLPVGKSIASKLYPHYESSYSCSTYMLSFNIPELFVCYDGDCGISVKDLNRDEEIFSSDIPVCFNFIWSDTISFCILLDLNWGDMKTSIYPLFAVYKLYKTPDGYDFYSAISPKPQSIPRKQAEKEISAIRKEIQTTLNGKKEDFYLLPDFHLKCCQIFTAYCSGVNAVDILRDSSCDASICHELSLFMALIDAYSRSKE